MDITFTTVAIHPKPRIRNMELRIQSKEYQLTL